MERSWIGFASRYRSGCPVNDVVEGFGFWEPLRGVGFVEAYIEAIEVFSGVVPVVLVGTIRCVGALSLVNGVGSGGRLPDSSIGVACPARKVRMVSFRFISPDARPREPVPDPERSRPDECAPKGTIEAKREWLRGLVARDAGSKSDSVASCS